MLTETCFHCGGGDGGGGDHDDNHVVINIIMTVSEFRAKQIQ